jgi:hypothetical protein
MQIKKTKNYDKFTFINGNRPIIAAHVAYLKESIAQENLCEFDPIIVNEEGQIVDGQHRFLACQQLDVPIHYVNGDSLGLKQVQRFNTGQHNWNMGDYAKSYAQLGNKDYQALIEFRKRWPFSWGDCVRLLTGGGTDKQGAKFREGKFKINNINQGVRWAKMIFDFKPYYENYKRRSFILALIILFKHPEYKHKQMLRKISYLSQRMLDCLSRDDYIKMLEKLYNFKNKEKIRFI